MTSKSSDSSDKDKDDEIKKISSGYTTSEINSILSKAKNTHTAKKNDLATKNPTHKNGLLNGINFSDTSYANKDDEHAYFEINGQPLRVELGFTADRDVDIAETRMHSGFDNNEYAAVKHLYFKGDAGLTLNIKCRIRETDKFIGEKVNKDVINYTDESSVFSVLSDWCRTFTPCKVVSYSAIVENGYYRIKECKPTQVYNNFLTVELLLVQDTYTYQQTLQTKQTMSNVNNVIRGQGVDKTKALGTGGGNINGKLSGLAKQLHDCKVPMYKHCTCTKRKKPGCVTTYSSCVKVLQQSLRRVGLYFDGRVDGLYCYITYNAVTKYQQRHKDKLNVTGKVDEATRDLLVQEIK